MGGGGSSKSSTSSTNITTDKRLVVDSGIGISSDSSTVTVNSLDAGIVSKALDTVTAADATNGQSFSQILSLADKLFTGAGEVIAKTQDTTLAQVAQVATAQNDAKGAIDQKTIVIIAVAGVAALALKSRKG